jgi:hypothetical protein
VRLHGMFRLVGPITWMREADLVSASCFPSIFSCCYRYRTTPTTFPTFLTALSILPPHR